MKIHWDMAAGCGLDLELLMCYQTRGTSHICILCSTPAMDDELVGLSLAHGVPPISTAPGAINHVLGRRSHPGTRETGTRGVDGWQRWWVVPHGVSLSRVVPRTIVGLSTQHVFGMTKVTQKMRWQGCLLQAKPSQLRCDVVWEDAAPFDICFSRRGDKVQGLARAGDLL